MRQRKEYYMPQSKTKSKKGASGMGNIRKITKTTKGKEYTYYEARYTAGYDPGTGKQIQRSISGKTQKEVADLLGISQSYISRLEKRIMLKLRKEMLRQTG